MRRRRDDEVAKKRRKARPRPEAKRDRASLKKSLPGTRRERGGGSARGGMRIVTWNVNGLRAAGRKGFLGWLATLESLIGWPWQEAATSRNRLKAGTLRVRPSAAISWVR